MPLVNDGRPAGRFSPVSEMAVMGWMDQLSPAHGIQVPSVPGPTALGCVISTGHTTPDSNASPRLLSLFAITETWSGTESLPGTPAWDRATWHISIESQTTIWGRVHQTRSVSFDVSTGMHHTGTSLQTDRVLKEPQHPARQSGRAELVNSRWEQNPQLQHPDDSQGATAAAASSPDRGRLLTSAEDGPVQSLDGWASWDLQPGKKQPPFSYSHSQDPHDGVRSLDTAAATACFTSA